jgi:predicted nucleic acid-binding protein
MGQKYLIDTNTVIDAQMNRLPEKGMQFIKNVINEDFTVSFVTYIEFLGYKDISQVSKDFIALANVLEINKSIIDTCIEIRKQQRIKLPDAIIASTALVHNLIVISRNVSDFKNITGLQVIDPYNL